MSESVGPIPKIARFTPRVGSLDRDALMFAAGRASARPARIWPLVAGLLAVSQAVTLGLLWPGDLEPAIQPVTPSVTQSPPAEEIVSPSPVPGSIGWYQTGDREPISQAFHPDVVVATRPPLRAGSHDWE